MNIYQTLLQFLKDTETNDRNYKRMYKKAYPNEYEWILANTHLTVRSPFPEVLYCFKEDVIEQPTCQTCGGPVRWSPRKCINYYRFCQRSCSVHLANMAAASTSSKQKRKDTLKEKYGVTNASHIPSVKETISNKKKEYWNKVYKGKDFTTGGLTRDQYRHRVQQYADTQYARYKDTLDPDGLRSKDWHVDHIYSVYEGFMNDVPVNIISDISNLRMLVAGDNYVKNKSSHKTLEELYEDCCE